LDLEKKSLKNQVVRIEEDMQMTIESYKSVLEASEVDEQTDLGKTKKEVRQMGD
jgi:hypothetical protein